jgi:hypothetical protein
MIMINVERVFVLLRPVVIIHSPGLIIIGFEKKGIGGLRITPRDGGHMQDAGMRLLISTYSSQINMDFLIQTSPNLRSLGEGFYILHFQNVSKPA